MISRVGVFFVGTAKFSPLARTARSSSDSWHWLRLMTFSVSKLEVSLVCAAYSIRSLVNFVRWVFLVREFKGTETCGHVMTRKGTSLKTSIFRAYFQTKQQLTLS